jgi:hypothetical protein
MTYTQWQWQQAADDTLAMALFMLAWAAVPLSALFIDMWRYYRGWVVFRLRYRSGRPRRLP